MAKGKKTLESLTKSPRVVSLCSIEANNTMYSLKISEMLQISNFFLVYSYILTWNFITIFYLLHD